MVMKTIGSAFMVAGFVAFAFSALVALSATDAADPNGAGSLVYRTDHSTGCEYFVSVFGNVTPRLEAGGKHRGCRQ